MKKELLEISESINVKLADKVRVLEASGEKVLKLQTGDPDFDTPKEITNFAYAAMNSGETHYCSSRGTVKLRQEISQKLKNQNGIDADPAKNILVTHGAVHGIYLALQAIINPGDEIIVISPYWMPYSSNISLAGGTAVVYETHIGNDFQINIRELEKKISKKTKAIIINSPQNPTGVVYDEATLKSIGDLSIKYDFHIISDEVYEDLIYEGSHTSIQSLFPEHEKIISIFSFSKSFAMTGWRVGYLVASSALIQEFGKLSQYIVTSISPFIQNAAAYALISNEVRDECIKMKKEYQSRRDFIFEKVKNLPIRKKMFFPAGAFYVFIEISSCGMGSVEFVEKLLEEYKVSFTPGVAFGKESDSYIRMTYATDIETIEKALDILISLDL